MHAVGLHSALAIKRQRKRRDEQKRAKERRYSTQSTESGFTSPHNSMGSLDHQPHRRCRRLGGRKAPGEDVGSKVVTSIGMLHIGVVFLVLGAFLLVSGLLPSDVSSWSSMSFGGWFNELVITGAFAFAIGLFLIILNRIISKREDDDLNEYVQRQLTRSKSGHRLVRDVETGCLTTKHQQRAKLEGSDVEAEPVPVHSPVLKSPPPAYSASQQHTLMMMAMETEQTVVLSATLEQIEEESEKGEEESRAMDNFNKEVMSNGSTTGGSLSPNSPDETQELLSGQARYLATAKI